MLEIPEAQVTACQLSKTVGEKTIQRVEANSSPHKFAFFSGDPAAYHDIFTGKKISGAEPFGGQVEVAIEEMRLVLSDGVNLRFYEAGDNMPVKHQLRLDFADGSVLIGTVQMYGMMWAFKAGENDNPYYLAARGKPNPLSKEFSRDYFLGIVRSGKPTLSVKAVLATEQRIPGLGNGVLQDILFNARINPRSKAGKLTDEELNRLFDSIKQTLLAMTTGGGRDTEKDIFGNEGEYATILSSKTFGRPCPVCTGGIVKQAFLGGSVYFCPNCQPVS